MKFIERMSLAIFSIIILGLSLILSLVLFNWLEIGNIYYFLQLLVSTSIVTNTTLIILIILMLLAIKCIFFPSYKGKEESLSDGILLENESGKLLISIDTIENLVKGVISGFPNVNSVNCNVRLDEQVNNVIININLIVLPDTVIKELSTNLQNKIKEVIKTTTEIEIKEINIKIKNIEAKKD